MVIDTSPMYGLAESTLGQVISSLNMNDIFFLATKVWTKGKNNGYRQMQKSLQKLETKQLQLMQVHNLIDCDTHLETLREWKEQKKIKFIGITHYTDNKFDELSRYIKKNPDIDFCQIPYSIANRTAELYFLDLCSDFEIATLINRPFEQKGLFRQVKQSTIPIWAKEFGCSTWAHYFLKYILAHNAVTCVIPATNNPNHLAENLTVGETRLPEKRELQKMVEYFESI